MKCLPVLILLVLVNVSCASKETRRQMNDPGFTLLTYIEHNDLLSFPQTQTWCNSLGGHLPFIQSQEDMDFLADKVIQKDVGHELTWLGMTLKQAPKCDFWLDGSRRSFTFEWYGSCSQDQHCHSSTECALIIRSKDTDHKKVCMFDYSEVARAVCVVERTLKHDVDALMKTVDDFKKQLETTQQYLLSLDEMFQNTQKDFQEQKNSIKQLQKNAKDTVAKMDSMTKASSEMNDEITKLKKSNESTEQKLKTSNIILYILLGFFILAMGAATFVIVRQHNVERKRMKVAQTAAFKSGQENAVANEIYDNL